MLFKIQIWKKKLRCKGNCWWCLQSSECRKEADRFTNINSIINGGVCLTHCVRCLVSEWNAQSLAYHNFVLLFIIFCCFIVLSLLLVIFQRHLTFGVVKRIKFIFHLPCFNHFISCNVSCKRTNETFLSVTEDLLSLPNATNGLLTQKLSNIINYNPPRVHVHSNDIRSFTLFFNLSHSYFSLLLILLFTKLVP